jgi:preprotein translocase subunit YajC
MPKMPSHFDPATLLAQAAAPTAPSAAPAGNGGMYMIVTYGLMLGALYFLFIAPQRKKQKAMETLLKSLKSGDEVITSSGIFGTITNVKDDRFVVRIADNTKIEVGKGFIQSVVKKADGDEVK